MPTMRRPSVTTADQLLELHDPPWRHELVRGELRTMSPAGHWHGDVCSVLDRLLSTYVHENKLGKVYVNDTGFVLARKPDTVLAPDLAFVRRGRLPKTRNGFFVGPPDLAIEVRSPGDSRRSVREKAQEWLAHGTSCVWIVDPRKQMVTIMEPLRDARELAGDDELTGGALVPGFAVSLRTIFAD